VAQRGAAPNVLILVFDALSARHMSMYGYGRETTPNLARFAERATVFHSHYASGNHTTPGVASMLTGTYPWSHRALHLHGTVEDTFAKRSIFGAFAARGYHTLAYSHNLLVTSLLHQFAEDLDILKKTRELCLVDDEYSDLVFPNDYNVSFWSEWLLLREGQSPPGSLVLSLLHRMLRFAHKRSLTREHGSLFPRGLPQLHSLQFILEDAIDWMADELSAWPQPFLAYVHLLPPHEPYTTRRDFVDRFDDGWAPPAKEPHFFSEGHSDEFLSHQRREYDEYVAYTDAEFGRLLDSLIQDNLLEDTCLVVTSDHGELFERGIRGHVTPVMYEPVIRVPLLISRPGQSQRYDIHSPTSAVDLMPTLLDATGQEIPDWCEGRVLTETAEGNDKDQNCVFSVEAKGNPKNAPLTEATIAMIRGPHKLVRYSGYEGTETEHEMYDLENDPEEMENLYSSNHRLAASLQGELEKKLQKVNEPYLQ
jgi:choline-sulfatase